jgi:crotonobetainyl-CoA:carnitine CoA-transferase CaiB-like acyl-CoA transferase
VGLTPVTLAPGLLNDFLHEVGEPPAPVGVGPGNVGVAFDGADPVLPTTLRLGELGAAAIAACGVLVARVHEERTGEAQTVRVAVDAAAAAMRSARYLRPDPPPPVTPRLGGLGVYRCGDGRWVYFQRLFPHHRDRIGAVLGVPLDEESITAACARRGAAELEDAVVAAGACAAMVRTPAEWAAHPQSAAVAGLPLVTIERIGDAPPTPLPPGTPPSGAAGRRVLGGLRVLDVTRVLAGPTASRTLAEHGADVLRVGTEALPDNDQMMRDTGHGKRSCALDLTTADDAATLRSLVAGADVFVQGYRPGAMDRLGFAPADLAALCPGVVAVSLSAFGHAGPWAARRGFDSVIQAANGVAHRCAAPDGTPRFAPANPLDYVTGYLAALGTLAALRRRARDGGSWLVRVSLARTGALLADLPEVAAAEDRPSELPADRLAQLMTTTDTPFGRLRHLAPAAALTATPATWTLPTAPLSHNPPEWLPR